MEDFLSKIEQGHHFNIDFNKRICKVGKKEVPEDVFLKWFDYKDVKEELQEHFDNYYYSTPSERSSHYMHTYFEPCNIEDLSEEQLIVGGNRECERFVLEVFMLALVIKYKWEDLFNPKHFFYKGNNGLVVLKDWFKGE